MLAIAVDSLRKEDMDDAKFGVCDYHFNIVADMYVSPLLFLGFAMPMVAQAQSRQRNPWRAAPGHNISLLL